MLSQKPLLTPTLRHAVSQKIIECKPNWMPIIAVTSVTYNAIYLIKSVFISNIGFLIPELALAAPSLALAYFVCYFYKTNIFFAAIAVAGCILCAAVR